MYLFCKDSKKYFTKPNYLYNYYRHTLKFCIVL